MLDGKIQAFAEAFERKLAESFSELADELQFFLIMRNSQKEHPWLIGSENYKWSGVSGAEKNKEWLKSFLERLNEKEVGFDKEIDMELEEAAKQEGIVYYFYESLQNDSRIEERRFENKKDIIWLVRGRTKDNEVKTLFEDVFEKTREQLPDLIFLSYFNEIPYIEKKLFQAVENKEGIRNRYTEKVCENMGGFDRELISLISAKKYEKRELFSRIYFGEIPDCEMEISFEAKNRSKWEFSGENLRFIRKVLETAKGERVLVVGKDEKGQLMRGIASLGEDDGNQITFNGYLKWVLTNKGKEVLRYEEGKFHFSNGNQAEEIEGLSKLHLKNEGDITKIINVLKAQSHGTSVVFLDGKALENELKRLDKNNRLCRIKPVPILDLEKNEAEKERFRELMIGISAIDGALIADYQGNIHAIGAILDGESVVEADMARGARYNSLKNYVNWLVKCKKYEYDKCFAVVLSEDGGINVEGATAFQ